MNYDQVSMQTKQLLNSISERIGVTEHRVFKAQSLPEIEELTKVILEIKDNLQLVSSNCTYLSNLISNSEPYNRRTQLRLSLDQMRFECRQYEASLKTSEFKKNEKEREIKERAELLNQDFDTNASYRNRFPGSTVIHLNGNFDHYSKTHSVSRHLDDLLASGSASFSALKDQGLLLKSARGRVMDVLNTLGLSNTVMRLVERRTYQDKMIFWFLCLATLLLMWIIWRFVH